MKKFSNPLHVKTLDELSELVSTVKRAEGAQCSFMNDMRSSGYGQFDGMLHTVEYRMILRKIELYHALYETLGIPTPEMSSVYADLTFQGDSSYSEYSLGEEQEFYDDDYSNYCEILYDLELSEFLEEFTSVAGVGDFKESVLLGNENYPFETLVEAVDDLKSKDLWDEVSSDFIEYAAGYNVPYNGFELEDGSISGEDAIKGICDSDYDITERILAMEEDNDTFIRLNEIYYIRSKKVGAALLVAEEHKKSGNATPEEELFLTVQDELATVYLVTCMSCRWGNGITESGDFYSAFVSLADAESDEGEGVPLILRHLPIKLYGYVAQELADRILSAEKKKSKKKEVEPANVRVKEI